MTDHRPRRRRWILAALSVTALALLAGTSTGRLQVYRALFTVGSPGLQIWTAERMGAEPAESALPIIFGMLEDPELPLPFGGSPGFDRELLDFLDHVEDPSEEKQRPEALLIRAGMRSAGFDHPLEEMPAPTDPDTLSLVISQTEGRRPALRFFALLLLKEMTLSNLIEPPDPQRMRETLRRMARHDPEPFNRCAALALLSDFDHDLAFYLSLLEAEEAPLTRGQILKCLRYTVLQQPAVKPTAAQREQILRARLRFWIERPAAVVAEARESLTSRGFVVEKISLPLVFYDHAYRPQADELRLRFVAWLRDHPEESEVRAFYDPDSERSPEPALIPAAIAALRANRRPEAIRFIVRELRLLSFDLAALLPIVRARLDARAPVDRQAAVALLSAIADFSERPLPGLSPILAQILADPRLDRAALAPHLHLLLDHPGADALLLQLSGEADPAMSLRARCLLGLRSSKAPALSPAALLQLLENEGPCPTRLKLWVYIRYTRWHFPSKFVREKLPTPARSAIRDLSPAIIPGLIRALRGYEPQALDRLLPKLRRFNREVLTRAAREPGALGTKARAVLGEE